MAASSRLTNTPATPQEQEWSGDFGKEYSKRNLFTPAELDALYEAKYGVSRGALNRLFLADVPRDARILEVGCNLGNQLLAVQEMGFTNLYGIELIGEVARQAQLRLPSSKIQQGSAFQIPYPDRYFDLVFTAGVLIHIAPSDLPAAMRELHRCSRSWIWGTEYFAEEMTEIAYRGHTSLLWKADYAALYHKNCPNLELIREQRLPYKTDNNVDSMFLLRRKG